MSADDFLQADSKMEAHELQSQGSTAAVVAKGWHSAVQGWAAHLSSPALAGTHARNNT